MLPSPARYVEAPTLGLLLLCYIVWTASICVGGFLGVTGVALSVALHASLQHEVIHGHPFKSARWNAALVAPALGLLIPFARFRDTHLAHHQDAILTDPYDDPETNYLDPTVWAKLPRWVQGVLRLNNTLAGRMLIGPIVAQTVFVVGDYRAARAGDASVVRGWLWHVPAVAFVVCLVWLAPISLGAYFAGAYLSHSLIKIRTFAEHRAHEHAAERSVIIEDRGPLALLFLNNNLHVVHHMHPHVAWHRLPAMYRRSQSRYQGRNGGYVFRSYWALFSRHLLRSKDPVPHPLYPASRGPMG